MTTRYNNIQTQHISLVQEHMNSTWSKSNKTIQKTTKYVLIIQIILLLFIVFIYNEESYNRFSNLKSSKLLLETKTHHINNDTAQILNKNIFIRPHSTGIKTKENLQNPSTKEKFISTQLFTYINQNNTKALWTFINVIPFKDKHNISRQEVIGFIYDIFMIKKEILISYITEELNVCRSKYTNRLLILLYTFYYMSFYDTYITTDISVLEKIAENIQSEKINKFESLYDKNKDSKNVMKSINNFEDKLLWSLFDVKDSNEEEMISYLSKFSLNLININIQQLHRNELILKQIENDNLNIPMFDVHGLILCEYTFPIMFREIKVGIISYLFNSGDDSQVEEDMVICEEKIEDLNNRIEYMIKTQFCGLSVRNLQQSPTRKNLKIMICFIEMLIGKYSGIIGGDNIRGSEKWEKRELSKKFRSWKEKLEAHLFSLYGCYKESKCRKIGDTVFETYKVKTFMF